MFVNLRRFIIMFRGSCANILALLDIMSHGRLIELPSNITSPPPLFLVGFALSAGYILFYDFLRKALLLCELVEFTLFLA